MIDRLLDRTIVASYDRTGFHRHARRFEDSAERDLHGARVLVTGGTAGIGLACSEALVERGAEVLLWGRSAERGREAAAGLARARFDAVDLGDLEAVERAARTVDGPLSGVVLNAGAMPLERVLTKTGHELIWASQVLGHLLLLRVLRQRGLLDADCRVMWVSSGGMYLQRLDLRDLTWERGYERHTAYANAKRAQVLLAAWLASEWPEVPMASMHPGWVRTAAVKHSMPVFHALTWPILRTPAQGADTIVWWLTRDRAPASGQLWFDRRAQPVHLLERTHEPEADRRALIERVLAETEPYLQEP